MVRLFLIRLNIFLTIYRKIADSFRQLKYFLMSVMKFMMNPWLFKLKQDNMNALPGNRLSRNQIFITRKTPKGNERHEKSVKQYVPSFVSFVFAFVSFVT